MQFLAPKWAQQQGYSAFTRKRVISFFWFLAWSYIIVKGNWWQIPFFSGKLPILRFRILTAVNMWKNAFFAHPLASEGWHWLKLSLNDVFITMKWLLICFECICSFLLSLSANKRLYIGKGMAGHAQAKKISIFSKMFIDSKWSNSQS